MQTTVKGVYKMVKEIVDLQRFSKATCAIIENKDIKTLPNVVLMEAEVKNVSLFGDTPIFASKLDAVSAKSELCYFVITDIDKIDVEQQNRFVGLVKDREINDYNLPNNCIVVFSVDDKEDLKNISAELYHFATVAF